MVTTLAIGQTFTSAAIRQRVSCVSGKACTNWAFATGIIVTRDTLSVCLYPVGEKWKLATVCQCSSCELVTPQGFGEHRSAEVNGLQLTNGSPVMSRGQLHTGVNPRKLQSAPTPQAPSQVFLHTP